MSVFKKLSLGGAPWLERVSPAASPLAPLEGGARQAFLGGIITGPWFGQGHWPAPAHMPCVHEVRWGLEQPKGTLPRPREAELRGVLEAAWAPSLLSRPAREPGHQQQQSSPIPAGL